MCGSCGCGSGSGRLCGVCKTVGLIGVLLLTATTVAAGLGVWTTHMVPAGWTFGTVAGSAALVTFILSLLGWLKVLHKVCGCKNKAASCCESGSGCADCSSCKGGVCPGCGKDPCRCK